MQPSEHSEEARLRLMEILPPDSDNIIEHLLDVYNNEFWDPMKDSFITFIIPKNEYHKDYDDPKIAKIMTFASVVGRLNGPHRCKVCGMTYDLLCLARSCCPSILMHSEEGKVRIHDLCMLMKNSGRPQKYE